MFKHYELFETYVGPMVLYGDELIGVQEYVRLFDVADDNPEFLQDLKGCIVEGLEKTIAEAVDSFKSPTHMVMIDQVQGYLNAIRAYSIFANHEYPRYRNAKQEAMKLD